MGTPGRFMAAAVLLATVAAALGDALLRPAPALAVAPTSSTVVETYDASLADWYVAGGSGGLGSVGSPKTQGSAAMEIDYDFSSSTQMNLAPLRTASASELSGLPRRFSIDVHGDGSWNVLYLQVRDATGEIFHYRLGNVSFTGWSTLSIEPGRNVPATTLSGNGDGVLDLPISLYKLVVDKNPGGTKTVSSIVVDNLVYEAEVGSTLSIASEVFVPSAGQATTVRVGPGEAGDVGLTLTDEAGRGRTFSGAAAGGGAQLAWSWNGRAGDGALMSGSVRGRLTITRGGQVWTYGSPYLAGLPVRYEPASPGSIVGINSALTTINTIDRATAESQARLMEGGWVRMARESFDWNRLETRKGWFEWAKFDQAVEVARAHNVALVGRLEYSASWASSAPGSAPAADRPYYPPSNVADYVDYVAAVVARYKDRVATWEIWNEENSAGFWKPAPSAAAYADLLKVAYSAIKAEDPGATVLLGGTVGFDKAFLDGIVTAGAWNSFDALAIHTYVAPQPETSMIVSWLDNARAYVAQKGAKPIWITEFGWSTYTGSGASYVGVSEAKQAEYTARTYLHGARVGIRGVFVYNLVEYGTSATSKLDNYGLVEAGGRQKPAYAALRRVAEALDGGTTAGLADPNAATRTTVDPMDATTGWTASPLGGGSASRTSSTTRHGGAASIALNYTFTGSSTGVELKRNLAVAGSPTMFSVWVRGDGSANPVYLKIADTTGETFQGAIGSLGSGWERLVLFTDGANTNWTHSGGDNDGVVDYPVTIRSLFVFRGGIGQLSGTAYFDDLQVESGPNVRGVVISRRSGVNQALYILAPAATASVPVTGGAAWRVDGASSTPLSVSGGSVSIALGASPTNVLSAAGLSPTTITPNGDGVADRATMSWISGDRAKYTFQVVSLASGAVVRNVVVDAHADAGLRSVAWDGKLSGAPAAPGTYRLRLAVLGPDGRTSYLLKDVVVQ